MQCPSSIYKGYRFPKEIISHAVWIYYRLNASLRDTAQALNYRGLDVSHETIRAWVYKFGRLYASGLRKRQPQRGDKWHLDEVCLRISYKAARKKLLKTTEHRSHKRLNNRIEVSHQATRLREKQMRHFKSPPQAQLFLSVFEVLRNWFKIGLYKLSAEERRAKLKEAFAHWHQITSQPNCA